MKKAASVLIWILIAGASFAQRDSVKSIFVYPITEYLPESNDSIAIVQVQLPDAAFPDISKNQLGILKHHFETNKTFDTAVIGWGRCSLVKSDYRYFGIRLYPGQKASPGDLLYMPMTIPLAYKGYMFDISRFHIHLQMVDDSYVYRMNDVYAFKNEADETKLLDTLLADIRYTGKEMVKQMPDQEIADGKYKSKKMFETMQVAGRSDLAAFLKYISVRPEKYAGNSWKISEIFATWLVSGAPMVVE